MDINSLDPRIIAHGVPFEDVKANFNEGRDICVLFESSQVVLDKWMPVYCFTSGDKVDFLERAFADSNAQGTTRNQVFVVMK